MTSTFKVKVVGNYQYAFVSVKQSYTVAVTAGVYQMYTPLRNCTSSTYSEISSIPGSTKSDTANSR